MRPSERLTLLVLLALALAALGGAPRRTDLALLQLALAAATALGARAPTSSRPAALVRDFLPIGVLVLVYLYLEPLIVGVNPRTWDGFFSALDDRWLAGLVAGWRGVLGRAALFTDASYVVYVSYYFLPITAAIVARRRGPASFERAVFAILLCFYASYAGYFLLPTAGPRLPVAAESQLGGGAVSDWIRAFLRHAGRNRLDAFPSGHTAVSLVSAVVGSRLAPRAAPALGAWAAAIVFTTVYVHVHYAVDVLAGAALGGAVLASAGWLARLLGGPRAPRAG